MRKNNTKKEVPGVLTLKKNFPNQKEYRGWEEDKNRQSMGGSFSGKKGTGESANESNTTEGEGLRTAKVKKSGGGVKEKK